MTGRVYSVQIGDTKLCMLTPPSPYLSSPLHIKYLTLINAVVQKCLSKKDQNLYAAFADFKKAFDSVHHDKLFEVVYDEGVKGNKPPLL